MTARRRVLAGVGAIWMAGRVAGLLYGRRAAPIAMALLIVSSLHLHYSQEARMYALLALSVTLFAGTSIRLIAWLGRLSTRLSRRVQDLVASLFARIPPHMPRQTIATPTFSPVWMRSPGGSFRS